MAVRTSSSITPPYVSSASIDLTDRQVDETTTAFAIQNPLGTVDFIYQILDTFTGKTVNAEVIRDLSNPTVVTVVFNGVVPNLKYRLFLIRIV